MICTNQFTNIDDVTVACSNEFSEMIGLFFLSRGSHTCTSEIEFMVKENLIGYQDFILTIMKI